MDDRLSENMDADGKENGQYQRNTSFLLSSGRMILCFLSYKDRIAKGYVKTIFYDQVFYFCGLDHMLLLMDDIMDKVNCPQRTSNYRNINGQRFRVQSDIFRKSEETEKVSVFEDAVEIKQERMKKVVTVEVCCRRNASIQGRLKLSSGDICFRSGMEIIRLLHEYLGRES